MSTWQSILAILTIFTCGFLMLVILIQRGRGSGLAGAFGGGGGSSAFGAKTGDVLTWATVIIAFLFLTLTVVANFNFDESPKAVAAMEPADLLEDLALPPADTSGLTSFTVPPLEAPAGESQPASTSKDGATTPEVPSTDDKPTDAGAANPGDKSGAAGDGG